MRLNDHLAASSAAGAGIWAVTGEAIALPIAVAAGVLPDADHLLDYFNWYVRRDFKRVLLLLHAWEWFAVVLLLYLLVWTEPWMLAIVAGYATQIGADQAVNGVHWHSYSLVARAINGFDASRVLPNGVSPVAYESLVQSLPFGRAQMRRWFAGRVHRRRRL